MKSISTLMREISRLQDIQKRNPYPAPAWEAASKQLAPLFAEMAKRQKAIK